MKSFGRTYIIEIPDIEEQVLEGGILLPSENKNKVGHYKGIIKEIGLGFHGDNEVSVGDEVIFNWNVKEGKVKIMFDQKLFYIVEENIILAKITKE